MWKNGQIVTVCGKKCRVKSILRGHFPCNYCTFDCDTSTKCESLCLSKERKLDANQYLEEIPAKGKVLAK